MLRIRQDYIMTEKRKLELTSTVDGLVMHADLYIPEKPRAIVHLMHGMCEHKERYEEFCNILARIGCVVMATDHRGHGESISEEIPLGYFADREGWLANLKDLNMFAGNIKEQYRRLPYFIIGHSMGSLFATSYLKRFEDSISGVVFIGMPAAGRNVATTRKLAGAIAKMQGPKKVSKTLMKGLSSFNDNIRNPRTPFDWISYNKDNVDRYIEDPLCGFPFTNQAMFDLMSGMADVYSNKDWRVLKPNLPILFLVGQDDPVADVPEGFNRSLENLTNAGYRNIEATIYENMRHEILNETGRKAVYKDILSWLDVQIRAISIVEDEKTSIE